MSNGCIWHGDEPCPCRWGPPFQTLAPNLTVDELGRRWLKRLCQRDDTIGATAVELRNLLESEEDG